MQNGRTILFLILTGLALVALVWLFREGRTRMASAGVLVCATWLFRHFYGLPNVEHPLGAVLWLIIVACQIWFIVEVLFEARKLRKGSAPSK
jgi:hypothetical protein